MGPETLAWDVVPIPAGLLYEGARWLPASQQFQWVDILGHTLHRWDPVAGGAVETRELDLEFVTVALPLDERRQLVASRSSLHVYDWASSSLTTVATGTFDDDVRFNDGALSPTGEVFVGTMSMAGRTDAGTLFRLDGEALVPVIDGVGISNGLAWADPASSRYVDSVRARVERLDWEGGVPARSVFADFEPDDEPDGLAIAPSGEVFVAMWRGAKVARLAADGTRLPDLAVPANYPTSVAFGGPDADLLLVTSAGHNEVSVTPMESDGLVFVARRATP